MSSFNRNTTKSLQTPFCKVCFDSGKTTLEYTSHFVKSEPGDKGVVVCPTLLSLTCRFCRQNGHTVKFCKVLLNQTSSKEKNERRENFQDNNKTKQAMVTNPIIKSNIFKALEDKDDNEEDDDDNARISYKIEKPTLKRSKSTVGNYALKVSALAMPRTSFSPPEINEANFPVFTKKTVSFSQESRSYKSIVENTSGENQKNVVEKLPKPTLPKEVFPKERPFKIFNWADCESSDEEDD